MIMDFGDAIVIPALLPKRILDWPAIDEEQEICVETEFSTHLPPSLFPFLLTQLYQKFGMQELELGLLSRICSVLVLDPAKENWEGGKTGVDYRVMLSSEQLRHTITVRVRAAPQSKLCCDRADPTKVCVGKGSVSEYEVEFDGTNHEHLQRIKASQSLL